MNGPGYRDTAVFLAIHVMCCDQDNVLVMVTPRRVMLYVGCNSLFIKWGMNKWMLFSRCEAKSSNTSEKVQDQEYSPGGLQQT